jgi:CelD/BcsL family acetyltransferase involved in cellulose biosynthesis
MTTVREINDLDELGHLREAWDDLLGRTPGASIFHTLDWLRTYWRHFGVGKRLRVLIVQQHAEVVGIVPLVVRKSRRSEPFRVLAYPLDNWGNFFGPIGPDPANTLRAGINHLRDTRHDWHFIELGWIDPVSDYGRTKLALDDAGLRASCQGQSNCAIVDLEQFASWENYLASHGSKWRQNLRQCERKLERIGKVTYVRYRAEGEHAAARWDLYDVCEAISRLSWQGSARDGTMLNKEANRLFFRECHRTAAERGAVDINLLYIDEAPVAFSYGYHHRGRVIGVKTAFDPNFSRDGTGRVLQARQIADSLARGDAVYELGPIMTGWKRLWMTELRRVDSCTHFPRRVLAAQFVRLKRAAETWWERQQSVSGAAGADSEIG